MEEESALSQGEEGLLLCQDFGRWELINATGFPSSREH